MLLKSQLLYTLATLLIIGLWGKNAAELLNQADTDTLNNVYENLLQREYAGPVVFPNHQVERKAQRSPSLRLRFGRRSDPDVANEIDTSSMADDPSAVLLPTAAKRWWGDVNQKPIRSPSLRLRFGKRHTEPALPLSVLGAMRNAYDEAALLQSIAAGGEDTLMDEYDNGFDRVVRKPQRLRWGRSVPVYQSASDANFANIENDEDSTRHELLNGENWRNMILGLSRYGYGLDDSEEFQREVRKPGGPLRLRWGRSTGGRLNSNSDNTGATISQTIGQEPAIINQQTQQKKSLGASAVNELQQHKSGGANAEVHEAKPLTKN